MNELLSIVEWSRAQFALTAFYHWLFVPLTLGMGVIVAVLETIYYRKKTDEWLRICKFWMKLFGINFAIGVATGIILEFEFGTNWSNYSWFVGDIFGAPLAIEGIFAFFMESTFFAVMFFGWKKFSPCQHLCATWLTALGASISAWWILCANAWMQHPVGMEFDPDTMRNVMNSFAEVALSPIAVNKFLHAVFSGWCLGGVFVLGVSAYFILKVRDEKTEIKEEKLRMAVKSIKVAGTVGTIGILMTMLTGDGTAVDVTKTQPMKLASMEGLYEGQEGTKLIGFGILDPTKEWNDEKDPTLFEIAIPYGLSFLGRHDFNAFIPGIKDIIEGKDIVDGKVVNTVPYAERIERGKSAQKALAAYDKARKAGDEASKAAAKKELDENYKYFGYGYFNDVKEAIPPVGLTFYPFHIMVTVGGWLLMFLIVVLGISYKKPEWLEYRWKNIPLFPLLAFVTIPLTYICQECGWMVAEIGRQPWAIQDIMPVQAAVSSLSAGQVQTTFVIFLVLFAALLFAEINIMLKQIKKGI